VHFRGTLVGFPRVRGKQAPRHHPGEMRVFQQIWPAFSGVMQKSTALDHSENVWFENEKVLT